MIHPSLIQKVVLDERQATPDIVADLKRSYNYVGPIMVGKHEASDPACNVFRMIIRMSKPYWRSSDPDGDAMWAEVKKWLVNKLYKVGSTMESYNNTHREDGRPLVEYGRLELEMKDVTLGFGLPTVDKLPAVDEQVARYRELLNAGTFDGIEVASVDIPSKESYAEQWEAAVALAEQKAAEEAARKAAEEAEAAAKAAEEAAAAAVAAAEQGAEGENVAADAQAQVEACAEGAAAAPQVEAAAQVETACEQGVSEQSDAQVEGKACAACDAAEGAEAADQPAGEAEAADAAGAEQAEPEPEPLKVEMLTVDYRVWGVVCADGTVRAFDSVAGAWL